MLLMNVAFLMMAETTMSTSYGFCVAIAILLHYFLLTSLMWMLTEAINMYHALITVFTTYTSQFILKRCFVAWGKYSWCWWTFCTLLWFCSIQFNSELYWK